MNDISDLFYYEAFGLTISTEFEIPELPNKNAHSTTVDVSISKRDLKSLWLSRPKDQKYFYIKNDFVMFEIENTAIFLIENGRDIYVSSFNNSKHDQVCLYLLGTCMGSILMQRKILPLHGSAIAIDGKAYAVVGDSGAGKSTLAAALLSKGYKLLSDDVIPVTLNEHGVPMVTPAYPQQKLWIESLDQFGMESSELRPIIDRETKFAVPVSSQFSQDAMPLAGVFELVKEESETISLRSVTNLQRLQLLYANTYRKSFIKRLGLMEWHFSVSAKMLNHIDLFQLQRPLEIFTANELADVILSTIEKGAITHELYTNA